MRWRGRRKSSNIEDRRSMRASGAGGANILRLLPIAFRFLGFKGTIILLVCVGAYGLFSGNLEGLLTGLGLQQETNFSKSTATFQESAEEKELVEFVSVILADTEET